MSDFDISKYTQDEVDNIVGWIKRQEGGLEKKVRRSSALHIAIAIGVAILFVVGAVALVHAFEAVGKATENVELFVIHLPAVLLCIVVAVGASAVVHALASGAWFDRFGIWPALHRVAERQGTKEEGGSDAIALGMAAAGSLVLTGLIAGALLLHYG